MKNNTFIRPIFKEDWPDISKIYKNGISTGIATFETEVPKWKKWKKSHYVDLSLAAQYGDNLIGFASLAPVSSRAVYKGVAEVSLYVHSDYWKKGVGGKLLESLIELSEGHGFWTLQSGIFPQNEPSIKLHEKYGFRVIGYREKVAQIGGLGHDNVLMERRSRAVNWK